MYILFLYGVPVPIIVAIRLRYDSPFSQVQTIDGLTAFFKNLRGFLQDGTLAHSLFIIVLDFVLDKGAVQVPDARPSRLSFYALCMLGNKSSLLVLPHQKILFLAKVMACQNWARACNYSTHTIFN